MNSRPDKYAQMQRKLREGLAILSQASNEDRDKLGMALIKLHASLEDFVRLEIATKAPGLRVTVDDTKQTDWGELIGYGKKYIGFSEIDARLIANANRQLQEVVHGGNFAGSHAELESYARFVQKWCDSSRRYQSSPIDPLTNADYPSKPWYRSKAVLFLSFFFLMPVSAILLLRDRNQGTLAKSVAASSIFLIFFCGIGLILNLGLFSPSIAAAPATNTNTPGQAGFLSSTDETCAINWVEYKADNLAGKTRAKVWEEIVASQISGSGMTTREFYDSVLEYNPDLVTDGYQFEEGKTYFLPECQ